MSLPLKWSLIVGGLTLLYWPLTLSSTQLLRSPEEVAACQADPYCRPNLLLGPVKGILSSGDTRGYFEPVYAVVRGGTYQPDYRMPGYGLLYGAGYLLTQTREGAFWVVAGIQVLLWSWALGLCLALGEERGVPVKYLWGIAFLSAFSPIAYYTRVLNSDSAALATVLLALCGLLQKRYFWAGLFLTWAFFMRPVLGILFLPAVVWVGSQEKASWLQGGRRVGVFLLPFLLVEGLWVARGYSLYGDFRPTHGTKTLLHPGMYHDFTPAVLEVLTLLGRNVFLSQNDPTHPWGLLLCEADTALPMGVWQRAFASLERVQACPPETLRAVGELICALRRSPTYTYAFREWELSDPIPTQQDCAQELQVIHALRRCAHAIRARQTVGMRLQAFLHRLWDLRYIPAKKRLTSKFRRLYYEFFWGLLLMGSGVALYFGVGEKREALLVTAFALLPLVAYMGLASVDVLKWGAISIERRYMDLQLPLVLLAIGWGLRKK